MNVLRAPITIALAIAAVALATPAADARTSSFSGDACSLLSASQLKPVHVSASCRQKSSSIRYGKMTWATWGNIHGAFVLAQVDAVNPAYAGPARALIDKGGTPVGVGDWSRFKGFANGRTEARIDFGVGHFIVGVSVRTPTKQPLTSSKPVLAIAKTIAAKLG